MSQTVHAMMIDGRRMYRVWSNSSDQYLTDELDEDGLRSQFLLWAIERAVREELLQPLTPLDRSYYRSQELNRTEWEPSSCEDEDDGVPERPEPAKPVSAKKAAQMAGAAAEVARLESDLAKAKRLAEVALKAIKAELTDK